MSFLSMAADSSDVPIVNIKLVMSAQRSLVEVCDLAPVALDPGTAVGTIPRCRSQD